MCEHGLIDVFNYFKIIYIIFSQKKNQMHIWALFASIWIQFHYNESMLWEAVTIPQVNVIYIH